MKNKTPESAGDSHLAQIFSGIEEELRASLRSSRAAFKHQGAKGEASELNWRHMLEAHLPLRYQVGSGFVVDKTGAQSHQIDLILYDRQYTPMLRNSEGMSFVPAESIYAVFEVKQKLDSRNVQYAQQKVASVRRLERTTAKIVQAGGDIRIPKPPPPILGGIIALESGWMDRRPQRLVQVLRRGDDNGQLDLGCALEAYAFNQSRDQLEWSAPGKTLLYFFLTLLRRLQELGTAPAIDYLEYAHLAEVISD